MVQQQTHSQVKRPPVGCTEKLLGAFTTDGTVTVTDPCYPKGTWCTLQDVPVKNGRYLVTAVIDQFKYPDELSDYYAAVPPFYYGVSRLVMHHKTAFDPDAGGEWGYLGSVGVDSGLCGFYNNKPDFSRDQWVAFVDSLLFVEGYNIDYSANPYGVCSASGGDGDYDVYTLEQNGETVAMKIVFRGR